MPAVTIDGATGSLRIGGKLVFPIVPSRAATTARRSRPGRRFEYVQQPLPPPIGAGSQEFRPVTATGGGFRDWLDPHDARVYRLAL